MALVHYFVVLHEGQWTVSLDGRNYGPYASRELAQAAARQAAERCFAEAGLPARVVVQGTDRQFRTDCTFGQLPVPMLG